MNRNILLTLATASVLMAACSSGDINLSPTTEGRDSNNTNNIGSGGSPNDICASYQKDGQTITGSADANGDCTASPRDARWSLPDVDCARAITIDPHRQLSLLFTAIDIGVCGTIDNDIGGVLLQRTGV